MSGISQKQLEIQGTIAYTCRLICCALKA